MSKVFRAIVAVLTVALFSTFAACGGGGGGAKSDEAFVGVWTLNSMDADGMQMTGEEIKELAEMVGVDFDDMFRLELDADGTAKMIVQEETMEGKWAAKDASTVTLTMDDESVDATLADGLLTLESDGDKMVFEKKKA